MIFRGSSIKFFIRINAIPLGILLMLFADMLTCETLLTFETFDILDILINTELIVFSFRNFKNSKKKTLRNSKT